MARKTPSRMELRKQAEAAESQGSDGAKKKKKKAKKKTATRSRRTKDKTPQRRRLVWAVFSASMKEEARFAYDQRDAAEQKVQQLRAKNDKPYFIQPIKEPIAETPAEETADTK